MSDATPTEQFRSPARPTEAALHIGGHAIGLAAYILERGGEFPPTLFFVKRGKREVVPLDVDDRLRFHDVWQGWVAANPEQAELSVYVADSSLMMAKGRIDAVLAHVFDHVEGVAWRFVTDYRPRKFLRSFSVEPPQLLSEDGTPQPLTAPERAQFAQGIRSVIAATKFWSKRISSILGNEGSPEEHRGSEELSRETATPSFGGSVVIRPSDTVLDLAGHAIGFGIWCVADDSFSPMVMFRKDGTLGYAYLSANPADPNVVLKDPTTVLGEIEPADRDEALKMWNMWIEQNPQGAQLSVFVADSFMTSEGVRSDVMQAHVLDHADGTERRFLMRYQPANPLRPLEVEPPAMVTNGNLRVSLTSEERASFVRGVLSVTKAASFWSTRIEDIR